MDDKNTKDYGTQTEEIAESVMKTDVSTSTYDIQNLFLNQSKTGNNSFTNAMGDSGNLLALTANDSASESTIDEALTLWKPYAQSNLCSKINNPFLNPFFDLLKLEDPLALFDEASEDGQLACANWVGKHQDLFLAQIQFHRSPSFKTCPKG
ncbi:hypothetical protein AVEN_162807-1 [Araneus ventricosus]|uniref:Uncharacterized protein n=1 Tax=Araneus ventricosus TaxID=182803 RepID=A0A4Y2C5Y3_ARAVE|nr:hypothetical protein AVEN_162807-1 [Araneus ventricosus]